MEFAAATAEGGASSRSLRLKVFVFQGLITGVEVDSEPVGGVEAAEEGEGEDLEDESAHYDRCGHARCRPCWGGPPLPPTAFVRTVPAQQTRHRPVAVPHQQLLRGRGGGPGLQ